MNQNSQDIYLLFLYSHLLFIILREIDKEASHRDGLRIWLKVGQPVEHGGLLEYFFGKDGSENLHYEKFSNFLKQLHDEVIFSLPSFVLLKC